MSVLGPSGCHLQDECSVKEGRLISGRRDPRRRSALIISVRLARYLREDFMPYQLGARP